MSCVAMESRVLQTTSTKEKRSQRMFRISWKARHMFQNSAQRSKRCPQLEILEDRLVLSIADGTILVLDNPSTPTGPNTALVGVNPVTGAQSIISTGQLFST